MLLVKHIITLITSLSVGLVLYFSGASKEKNFAITSGNPEQNMNVDSINMACLPSWNNVFHYPNSKIQKGVNTMDIPELDQNIYYNSKKQIVYSKIHGFKKSFISDLPVVAITASPSDLFGEINGIYSMGINYYLNSRFAFYRPWWDLPANYSNRNSESKSCLINFYSSDSKTDLCVKGKLKISGNATRAFPNKSFRINTQNSLEFKNNDFAQLASTKSLVIRNGGNDATRSLFADYFMQQATSLLNVPYQKGLPVLLFVNSRFWGIYFLLNRYDKKYASAFFENNTKGMVVYEQGTQYKSKRVAKVLTKIREGNAQLDSCIDWKVFYDYIFVETFFANSDWPNNNVRMLGGKGVRWKMALYDMDYGMAYNPQKSNSAFNMFQQILKSKSIVKNIFDYMLHDKYKLAEFKERVEYILTNYFTESKLTAIFNKCKKQISSSIKAHCGRWGYPQDQESWLYFTELNFSFLKNRIVEYKKNYKAYLLKCATL